MLLSLLDICLGMIFVIVFSLYLRRYSRTGVANPPPGPRPLPIIGNAHQMPLEHPEMQFAEWNSTYGDIIFLRLFRSPTLVVNSRKAARDLMEKRSTKYSDRPRAVYLTEVLDWQNLGFMQYGETLRKHRRWIQSPLFERASLGEFLPVQVRETQTLLVNLLRDPDHFASHLHRFAGSVILETFFGHSVSSEDDEYLILSNKANKGIAAVSAPGAALVDFIPALQYVPSWFPGAWWQRLAIETKAAIKESTEKTYLVAENLSDDKPSIIGSLIREYREARKLTSQVKELKMLGSAAYAAGTDTTNNILQSFILAMVLYPEVLNKAQEEMDRIVCRDRLPTILDRDLLPYLECVLKETYRWACPIPLGIPHATSEDDEYRGFYIPKGTTIIPNLWFMLRDPDDYPEPESFNPDRFLGLHSENLERIDPRNAVFGYGRRICPGRRFADISSWLVIANLIAAFDIHKSRDALGNEIIPPVIWEPGLANTPIAFECSIKPRSPQVVELIMNAL